MAALEPVFTTVIAVVGGGFGVTVLRYFGFFRKNKVEDRATETERLEAENLRVNKRSDELELDLDSTRAKLHREQDYVAMLRAQLFEARINPLERPKNGR